MPFFVLISVTFLFSTLTVSTAEAANTVAAAQREVDRLRTIAAEKYEAANETNIRIKSLEREMSRLSAEAEDCQKKT